MAPFSGTPDGIGPELLDLLDEAFTATWHELQARNSPAAASASAEMARAAIAQSIRDLAATGVRDLSRLKRHGLHAAELARPWPRTIVRSSG
jgi:hypothetical protein